MNILFHIDEMNRWNVCLSNIENTLKYSKDSLQPVHVEIIVNAEAVQALSKTTSKDINLEDRLYNCLQNDVSIKACVNALNGYGIDARSLIEGVIIIPSAIIEIASKQVEGFAYIRP